MVTSPREKLQRKKTHVKQGLPLLPHEWAQYGSIIVFDGVCNFCNAFVNFVLERDHQGLFKFGTLQSPPAQQILEQFQLSTDDYETFLLIEHGKLFTKSTAALKILQHLGIPWSLFGIFRMIPRQLRDPCYDFIARHRYRWMGKSDSCRVPTQKELKRFV